jgi:hypothetical protein
VTTGTIFHKTKQPLSLWFRAIYEIISNPSRYTAHGMWVKFKVKNKEMRYETAYFMRQRVMELFRIDYSKVRKLDGTYEFDGLYSGPDLTMMIAARRQSHSNIAGLSHKVCISAIVNRGKSLYGRVMPYNTNKLQEQGFIKSIIPKKATAYSDSSSLYLGLNRYIRNYRRFNHSKGQYGQGSAHTNTLGGIATRWRNVESSFQYISHKYLQRYWDEFCFKYNCEYNGMTTISQQFEYALGNMERHKIR